MTTDHATADIQLIQRILPHRYPILLVDRVIEFVHMVHAGQVQSVSTETFHFGDATLEETL